MSLPLIRELGGINQKILSQLYDRRVRGDLDNEIIVACKFLPHDVNLDTPHPQSWLEWCEDNVLETARRTCGESIAIRPNNKNI